MDFFIWFFILHVLSVYCGRYRNDDISQKKEELKMSELINAIASILETIANLGAGSISNGIGYEPELPEELRK